MILSELIKKSPHFASRLILSGLFLIACAAGVFYISSAKIGSMEFPKSTKIYDRSGTLLYELFGEVKRTPVALADIPLPVQEATIAIEDKDFYKHAGIDPASMVRAAWVNSQSHSLKQGGSTISQQLVRNLLLTRQKSFSRKLKEIALSLVLERRYNKQQILEMYLNTTPYGANAYGVEAASQTFFGKSSSELTLAEAAYLAALPKAPTYYSPYGPNREKLDERARLVLSVMKDQGYIDERQYDAATAEKVSFRKISTAISAPHFVMYILDQLRQQYGDAVLLQSGLDVTTTLDPKLQAIAEDAIDKRVPANERNNRASNAALVAIDPKSGQILAMVGSRNYFDTVHDGAVNVTLRPRQPGSSFKPIVYATAFENGMSPATMIMDVRTNFGKYGSGDYVPRNYDGTFHGPVSIRQALAGSLNVPAVKTLMLTGIDKSIDTAEAMGITTLKDRSRYGPSLVLGGGEVTLLQHTGAFAVFAAAGVRHDATGILEVRDRNGLVLQKYEPTEGQRALDPAIAYQITDILSDNNARQFIFGGLSRYLTLPGRPVAAKTGTTQEFRDAWTMGYTPSLAAGVWVGNNDNSRMSAGSDGAVVAAPIWHDFMQRALENTPVEKFERPDDVVELAVDAVSGKLPTQYTPSTKTEIFAPANIPTEKDDVHVALDVNGEKAVLAVYHSEKPNDPGWEGGVLAWAQGTGNYPYQPASEPTPPPIGEATPPGIKWLTDYPALGGLATNQ